MRECTMNYVDRETRKMVTVNGVFHQWGTVVEEGQRGMVCRTVAIVEDSRTHEIIMAVPNKLSFADETPAFKAQVGIRNNNNRAMEGIKIPSFVMARNAR